MFLHCLQLDAHVAVAWNWLGVQGTGLRQSWRNNVAHANNETFSEPTSHMCDKRNTGWVIRIYTEHLT